MLSIKTFVLALTATCGLPSNTAPGPDDVEPPNDQVEDQHFCCTSVSAQTWSGEGCVAISKENINSCQNVLYCPGKWAKADGTVTCA